MKRYNFLSAGRRWRKTTFCIGEALEYALGGGEALYTAPVNRHLGHPWREAQKACGELVAAGLCLFNKTENSITFTPNDGRVFFASLEEPDNCRGFSPGLIVVDEAGMVRLEEAYYDVLRPMELDYPDMKFIIGGTPNGMNWFWREWAKDPRPDDTMCWQIPTLGCDIVDGQLVRVPNIYENPTIPWSILEKDFRDMTERKFRQEIMAEFIEDGGGVFRNVRGAIRSGDWKNEPYCNLSGYTMAVDLARVHDYTVITVVRQGDLRQVYHERFTGMGWERQMDRIKEVSKQYGYCPVNLDSTGVGDAIYDTLRRQGVTVKPFKFTNASKESMCDHLAMLIEKAETPFLMDIPAQTNELLAYQEEKTQTGMTRLTAPRGMNDDCVTALMMAYAGLYRYTSGEALAPVVGTTSEWNSVSVW